MKLKIARKDVKTEEYELLTCPCGNDNLKVVHGPFGYLSYFCRIKCERCNMETQFDHDLYDFSPDFVISRAVHDWNAICKCCSNKAKGTIYVVERHDFDRLENHNPCYTSVVGYALTHEQAGIWCDKEMSNIDNKKYQGWDGTWYPFYTIRPIKQLDEKEER